jgi:KDO2-lipid IV(A) lauroyltransferase
MAVFFALFQVFSFITSRFPFPVMYFFADILKFTLQYIIRYRREVTLSNLRRSFPGKSNAEIKKIASDFYRNLAEVTLEVIKLESINKEALHKRFRFDGLEIMEEAFSKEKSVIVTIGHCGNWEWMGTALGLALPVKGFAIIKPLSEKRFHHYLESLRHRLNPGSTIDFQHTYRNLVRNQKSMVTFNVFAADQTPTRSDINHWSLFLNQDTAFFNGVEKLARSLDFTVVFMDIYRSGRGKYVGDIRLITDDPKSTAENEITEKYIHLLENAIISRPDNWLWSHRRWKFSRGTAQS